MHVESKREGRSDDLEEEVKVTGKCHLFGGIGVWYTQAIVLPLVQWPSRVRAAGTVFPDAD